MKLLGITLEDELQEVRLCDCPSVIDKGQMAMLGKPGSSLIYQDSIVYYDEEHDVAEGDMLFSGDEYIGFVYYSKGWRVHDLNGLNKELYYDEYLSMKSSERNLAVFQKVNHLPERKLLIFANGKEGTLFEMAMIDGDEISIVGRNKRVYRNEVYLSTGLYTKKKKCLYFGQFLNGGVLSLNNRLEFVIRTASQEIKLNMEDL